jgi:hypothetical protein
MRERQTCADEMISTQEEEKKVTKGIAVPLALLQSFYSVLN